MGRGVGGGGDCSREAIISNISIKGGDYSRDGYYSRKYGSNNRKIASALFPLSPASLWHKEASAEEREVFPGGGVLLGILGGGVTAGCPNPDPFQTRMNVIFHTRFQTWAVKSIYPFLDVASKQLCHHYLG